MNDTTQTHATEAPAVGAPVEQPVRPRYWMTREAEYRLKNGGNAKGAVPVHARPSVAAKIPLYGQAELDAAVAAERERLRLAFFKRFKGSGEQFFDYLHGDEEAERCVAGYWQEVLDELLPNAKLT